MILVLIPSRFEAKPFAAGLERRREFTVEGAECVEGETGGIAVTLGVIGMGQPHSAKRAKAVIEHLHGRDGSPNHPRTPRRGVPTRPEIRGVILGGFAGALHPELKRGEIFVTAGAEHLLPLLPEAERPREAKLHTAEKIAGTAQSKADLHRETGAWLVDMEQAHVTQIAAAAGLPFVGLRIVSDEAQEDLPHETLAQAYDIETGTETPWKLAGHLTRNPFRTVPLASFVRSLPPVRTRMSDRLHTWLKLTGPRLFR